MRKHIRVNHAVLDHPMSIILVLVGWGRKEIAGIMLPDCEADTEMR